MKSLTIALDYDDTFTADPVFWSTFCWNALEARHHVVCITGRRESFEARRELELALGQSVSVYFAYDYPKKLFAEWNKIHVDIWIDDKPDMICEQPGLEDLQRELHRLRVQVAEIKHAKGGG